MYLNLVLEFVPKTLFQVAQEQTQSKELSLLNIKLYIYQTLRSLAYIHTKGICHRDIKPQNLLVNPETHELKLCDFGSAKILQKGESNVAYICSRYYRAPELIFGAIDYTTAIGKHPSSNHDSHSRCMVHWLRAGRIVERLAVVPRR